MIQIEDPFGIFGNCCLNILTKSSETLALLIAQYVLYNRLIVIMLVRNNEAHPITDNHLGNFERQRTKEPTNPKSGTVK